MPVQAWNDVAALTQINAFPEKGPLTRKSSKNRWNRRHHEGMGTIAAA
jgi:hypothetical protein